jgi:hypothetical protein
MAISLVVKEVINHEIQLLGIAMKKRVLAVLFYGVGMDFQKRY